MDCPPPDFGWPAARRRDIFLRLFEIGLPESPTHHRHSQERVCLFAFQKWTSYPLVLVMIAMGIYLRHYSPIPKPYLAILYIGLGLSLFISSLLYYRQAFRTSRTSSSASPDQPF